MTGWVDSRGLAALLGVTQPKASKIIRLWLFGRPYRGTIATIATRHGRGGHSGLVYLVAIDSLPAELRPRAAEHSIPMPAPLPIKLPRKRREDRGERRCDISRAWDSGVPFDEAQRKKIAAALRQYVRGAWAIGFPSASIVCDGARKELIKLTRAAGFDPGDAELLRLCRVPAPFVAKDRRKYAMIHTARADAKRFFDRELPNVRRSRAHLLPMECVAGDVHHIDILTRRDDGSTATVKMVTWADLANNRLFVTPFLLAKGEGICREHVALSFAEMATHPQWGLPGGLYLDNGGEYNWSESLNDILRLGIGRERIDLREPVTRARPYNAPAKVIETFFATLERGPFAMLPGYIGGNRMKAKTHNVGKAPQPFPGSGEDFRAAIDDALAYYHTRQQAGFLAGRSPNDAFNAAVAAGWDRTDIDADALALAFADVAERTIDKGAIHYKGRVFGGDALLALGSGGRVFIRVPLIGDAARVAVFDETDKQFLCWAAEDEAFRFGDVAGAREQSRRASVQRALLRQRGADVPRLDMRVEMREIAALAPPAIEPASAGQVRLAEPIEAAASALKKQKAARKPSAADVLDANEAKLDRRAGAKRAIGE